MIVVDAVPSSDRQLVLARIIDLPREKLFRAWTEPELIRQWFTPRPWTVSSARAEVRAGGSCVIVMRSPEGEEVPHRSVYLEVVPKQRIVFTDAYTEAWLPSEKPFITAIVTFEDLGGRTLYTVRVEHWTVADRQAHEKWASLKTGARSPSSSPGSRRASEFGPGSSAGSRCLPSIFRGTC